MNKMRLQLLAVVGAIVGFLMLLGVVGDYDYTEQCILRMSQDEYDTIRKELTDLRGQEPSERDIAHFWAERNR
jgi:hypothetical protein